MGRLLYEWMRKRESQMNGLATGWVASARPGRWVGHVKSVQGMIYVAGIDFLKIIILQGCDNGHCSPDTQDAEQTYYYS